MRNFKFLLTMLVLIPVIAGCGQQKEGKILASIDSRHHITLKDFNARIAKLPERYQAAVDQNKRQFLDELIVDRLLYDEALKKKLNRDKEVLEVVEEARKKILIARLLKEEVEDLITIDESEMEAFYNANRESFNVPEVLRASHILVKTEGEANEIVAELKKGADFEELARERSIDPTAKIGGDVGYFTENQLVPEFEEICFSLQPGELSEVVKTKFGYHVIMLTERKEPHVKDLSEVRDVVAQAIKRQKKTIRFNEYVERLKEESKITINDSLLETKEE
ncbi:MAG: peptidylprolyl isomerase [Candidatus Omnitrophica bacterium]|nr:peptidylprolyl isomerase [Candidatus Omnitrophota bacterium]